MALVDALPRSLEMEGERDSEGEGGGDFVDDGDDVGVRESVDDSVGKDVIVG